MNISLSPAVQRFAEEQVKSGRFDTVAAVVEEAVSRLMVEADEELDEELAAAINQSEEQIDAGQGIDLATFAADWRRRLAGK